MGTGWKDEEAEGETVRLLIVDFRLQIEDLKSEI
jgi:hypothetical protein